MYHKQQYKQVHHSVGLFSSAPPPLVLSTTWVNSSSAVASCCESRASGWGRRGRWWHRGSGVASGCWCGGVQGHQGPVVASRPRASASSVALMTARMARVVKLAARGGYTVTCKPITSSNQISLPLCDTTNQSPRCLSVIDLVVSESASKPPSGFWCLNDKTIK
jgi:hypothetical protein